MVCGTLSLISNTRLSTFCSLVQNIFLGVLIGLMYLRMGKGQTTVFNRLGLLFFVMVNQGFGAMFSALNVCTWWSPLLCCVCPVCVRCLSARFAVPAEKKVVDRERLVGLYQVSAYYASKQAVEIIVQVAFPIVIGCIVYVSYYY